MKQKQIKKAILYLLMGVSFLFNKHSFAQESDNTPERNQIDIKYTLDLTQIYKSDTLWETDYKWLEDNIIKYNEFKGKISHSIQDLKNYLKFYEGVGLKISKLYWYSYLIKDIDLSNPEYMGMFNRANELDSKVKAANSFFEPEILTIPEEKILSMLNEDKELKPYYHIFDNIIRKKTHSLIDLKEEVIALTTPLTQIPYTAFSQLTNIDFYSVYGENYDTSSYTEHLYTLASLFEGNVTINRFYAGIRNFNSTREAALFKENIPVVVYDNLVNTVNDNKTPFQNWIKLRCKILGKDKINYDEYFSNSIFTSVEKEYSYEEATNIITEALSVLGKDYKDILQMAFNDRWIDVYPTKNKMFITTAYACDMSQGHPYIFLNWNNQFQDVSNLAHEMGHAINSYFINTTQPFVYRNITPFIAEVASQVNEFLLLEYLIEHARTKEEKIFLTEKYLYIIDLNFYFYTLLAEFEMQVYNDSEKGITISKEYLNNTCVELFRKYYGNDLKIDTRFITIWSQIPAYFYDYNFSFFNYGYAEGLAIACRFVNNIKINPKTGVKEYINFLKAGNSEYHVNILNKNNINITSNDYLLTIIEKMDALVKQMGELTKNIK